MRSQTQFHVNLKISLQISIYRNFFVHKTIIQYLSTADISTLLDPFVHCAFSLAVATPVRKTFTTDVGRMQRRRRHMTVRDL